MSSPPPDPPRPGCGAAGIELPDLHSPGGVEAFLAAMNPEFLIRSDGHVDFIYPEPLDRRDPPQAAAKRSSRRLRLKAAKEKQARCLDPKLRRRPARRPAASSVHKSATSNPDKETMTVALPSSINTTAAAHEAAASAADVPNSSIASAADAPYSSIASAADLPTFAGEGSPVHTIAPSKAASAQAVAVAPEAARSASDVALFSNISVKGARDGVTSTGRQIFAVFKGERLLCLTTSDELERIRAGCGEEGADRLLRPSQEMLQGRLEDIGVTFNDKLNITDEGTTLDSLLTRIDKLFTSLVLTSDLKFESQILSKIIDFAAANNQAWVEYMDISEPSSEEDDCSRDPDYNPEDGGGGSDSSAGESLAAGGGGGGDDDDGGDNDDDDDDDDNDDDEDGDGEEEEEEEEEEKADDDYVPDPDDELEEQQLDEEYQLGRLEALALVHQDVGTWGDVMLPMNILEARTLNQKYHVLGFDPELTIGEKIRLWRFGKRRGFDFHPSETLRHVWRLDLLLQGINPANYAADEPPVPNPGNYEGWVSDDDLPAEPEDPMDWSEPEQD